MLKTEIFNLILLYIYIVSIKTNKYICIICVYIRKKRKKNKNIMNKFDWLFNLIDCIFFSLKLIVI